MWHRLLAKGNDILKGIVKEMSEPAGIAIDLFVIIPEVLKSPPLHRLLLLLKSFVIFLRTYRQMPG
jgi:hypothetical protein